MNPTPTDIRADAASRSAGAGSNIRAPGLDDAAVRHRLRAALERELTLATAAGDFGARERLLASVQRVITI
jgi:hypothetical protein